MTNVIVFFLLELLAVVTFNNCFCNGSCVDSERQALLTFKQDLEDPSNRLASWSGDGDCCTWNGVTCDNFTGNALELSLRNPFSEKSDDASFDVIEPYERSKLVGKINPSLLHFKYLIHLDLSGNNFQKIEIPEFLGSLRELRYLNLSQAALCGVIPRQLGNLSNLRYLDLTHNFLQGPIVHELQNLISLRHLDLSHNDFNSSIPNWLYKLAHLEYLSLGDNSFQGVISRSFGRLCNLRFVSLSNLKLSQEISEILDIFSNCISDKLESMDLSSNQLSGHLTYQLGQYQNLGSLVLSHNSISGSIPSSGFGEQTSLKILDLSYNKLNGSIPSSFGKLSSLAILDLSDNELTGSIPSSLGGLLSLRILDLANNKLNGPIPLSLGKLSSLEYLYLSNNKLNGTLSQLHFADLSQLSQFDASDNSLMLEVNPDWSPPFQLEVLHLRSCHLGTHFPSWIRSQELLEYLDLSNTGISDTIPTWFWKSFYRGILFLNLSHNQIYGEIPDLPEALFRSSFDLSSNNLSGRLPRMSSNITRLDLSSNALSGTIFNFLCYGNGTHEMKILYLGNNFLSGELPDCWINWPYLLILNLDYNRFVGNLPMSMGTLTDLESLSLRKNNFSGPIPSSLENFTQLIAFDLGENEFTGKLPTWMGERFSSLMILNLRSNKFSGHLPTQLCHLTSLQILDLAHNNFSGAIPRCISNFSAMVKVDYSLDNNIFHLVDFVGGVDEDALLIMK